jgi:hypothetical protein
VSFCREGNEETDRIYYPSKELFLRGPVGITESKLLDGVWGLAMSILLIIWSEEEIKTVEDVPAGLPELGRRALAQGKEVVNKDVDIGQGCSCWHGRRGEQRLGAGRPGEAFELMSGGEVGEAPGMVHQVGRCFGCSAEERSGFDEAHWEGQVEADDGLRVP